MSSGVLAPTLPYHKQFSPQLSELQAYAIDCVIVVGKMPTDPSQISSFEMMRSQFKDVRIVTFDELFGKLLLLREMLTGERYVSPLEDDEGEEPDYPSLEDPDENGDDPDFVDGED